MGKGLIDMAINLPVEKSYLIQIGRPVPSEIPHWRRMELSPIDLSSRTPGAAMTPGGPREDILQTIRIRLLDVYEPVAARFGIREVNCLLRKAGSEIQFIVSLNAEKAIPTSDLIQDFLGPLAEKLIGCSWFDVSKGGVSGVFYRHQIKAQLNYQPHGQVTIYGSLR